MKKTLIFLIAATIIVLTAYYWWVLPIAFIVVMAWLMFKINRKEKKRETPIIPIEDYLD